MHRTALVVIRYADNPEEAVALAEAALAPFDEQLDFPIIEEVTAGEIATFFKYVDKYVADGSYSAPPQDEDSPEYKEWLRHHLGMWMLADPNDMVYNQNTDTFHYPSTVNPQGRWDWYSLGGRWRGFFYVNEGVCTATNNAIHPIMQNQSDPALKHLSTDTSSADAILGESGDFIDENENFQQRADAARKRDIDFDASYVLAEMEASFAYDTFEKATAGLAPPPCFREFMDKGQAEGKEPAAVRKEYNSLPWVKALREAGIEIWGDARNYFCVDSGGRDSFIKNARDEALATCAVLVDGEWYERDEMDEDTLAGRSWVQWQQDLIKGLPDDAWLLAYDLHS